jgi:hypothetical protein
MIPSREREVGKGEYPHTAYMDFSIFPIILKRITLSHVPYPYS